MHSPICSICLDEFRDPVTLPCQHSYCNECITKHLTITKNCPTCRRVFCNLIGEPLHSYEIQQQGKYQVPQTDPWKNPRYKVFPIVLYLEQPLPQTFHFIDKKQILIINAALKGSQLLVFQSQDQEDFGTCDIVKISAVEVIQWGKDQAYHCHLERVDRAKIIDRYRIALQQDPTQQKCDFVSVQEIKDLFPSDKALLKSQMEQINSFLEEYHSFTRGSQRIPGFESDTLNNLDNINNQHKATRVSVQLIINLIRQDEEGMQLTFGKDINKRLAHTIKCLEQLKIRISLMHQLFPNQLSGHNFTKS